jgi:hypothetical protein
VTEEGKQRSRCNAVRHGLTAETVIGALEDAEDSEAFQAAIVANYDAQSAVERELVLRFSQPAVAASPRHDHTASATVSRCTMRPARALWASTTRMSRPPKKGRARRVTKDHRHRLRTIRPYEYRDAATLLADFWAEVETVLKEKGV